MLKLAIDLTSTTLTQGGTAVYACELLTRFQASECKVETLCFAPWFSRRRRLGRIIDTLRRESLWVHRSQEKAAATIRADVLFVPTLHAPFRPGSIPRVITVHDLNPVHFPEMYRPWHLRSDLRHLQRSITAADHVITVSDFTRDQLLDHVPALDPARVTTIHHGVDPRFRPPKKNEVPPPELDLPPRYLLSVSTLSPNKNAEGLLRAWKTISDKIDMPLIFAGAPGWKGRPLMDVANELGVGEKVRHLGFVDDNHLPGLYRHATAFAFPSSSEGFGLPVLEAMASGVPVVTSTSSSLPEVAGDAALLVDPRNTEAISEGLHTLLTNEGLQSQLRGKGLQRASGFTWERSAARHLEVFRGVAR